MYKRNNLQNTYRLFFINDLLFYKMYYLNILCIIYCDNIIYYEIFLLFLKYCVLIYHEFSFGEK